MHIVTGGTHGIGRACADFLARKGEQVLVTGRDLAAGMEVAATLPRASFLAGDVGDPEDVRRIVGHALELGGGRLAGLVNNAGMSRRVAFLDAEVADWDQILAVNARSAFLFTRCALPGLIAGKGAVVLGMTQALALEFGADVRFNAVCPGQIATRMMGGILGQDEGRRRLELRIPAGGFGTPEEVAEVIGWLLSPAARYVNGAVITADGGETAGLRTSREPKPPS